MSETARHLAKALWLLVAYSVLILIGLGIEHLEQLVADL
jgi:hypothetical protein